MSETMIPTMRFRWLVPSFAAYGIQPNCRRLQQLFHTSRGDKWIDVQMVEEEPDVPKLDTSISPETQAELDEIDANIRSALMRKDQIFVD